MYFAWMIKLHYKEYCSLFNRMFREAKKKVYFKQLIDTSENKTKTMWNVTNKLTRKAEKSNHLPHSLIMNNKEVSMVKTAEAFNNYFLNMAGDLQVQIDN